MRMTFRIVWLVMCFQLLGCATQLKPNQVRITYYSDPPGAVLSSQNQEWGMAPQTRIFTGVSSNGAVIAEVTALWPSGATETDYSVISFGKEKRVMTIRRPNELLGLDRDMEFARQLKQKAVTKRQESADALFLVALTGIVQVISARSELPPSSTDSSAEHSETFKSIMNEKKVSSYPVTRYDLGYQTRDSLGNLVNSEDSYQTRDSLGNIVDSRDSYQTKDSMGNLVNSRDCYQTTSSTGALVQSAGCSR